MPITDPNQQYFKDGGWSWTGSKWIKGGLPFEYAGVVCGRVVGAGVGAGSNTLLGDTVPANVLWVITAMSAWSGTFNLTSIRLGVLSGGFSYWIAMGGAVLAPAGFSWSGQAIMVEGDIPSATLTGCTAGDNIYFYYFGYAMRLT